MMSKYRAALPQLGDALFLTDGGLETTLVFHDEMDLPEFAAFDLLKSPKGESHLLEYFRRYARIAQALNAGFVLESVTWRANPDWASKIGYDLDALAGMNRKAIKMLETIRVEFETDATPYVISGCVGPRRDGYDASIRSSEADAEKYHAVQIETFAGTAADMITAITMTHAEEAIGVTRASRAMAMPVAISFTVETDGTLPSGQPLREAIEQVDEATDSGPVYYMVNCAHPTHFDHVFEPGGDWHDRIKGLRANASRSSHEELDNAEVLDEGNPEELGQQYRDLLNLLNGVTVVGGCCGTDHRHIEAIGNACRSQFG